MRDSVESVACRVGRGVAGGWLDKYRGRTGDSARWCQAEAARVCIDRRRGYLLLARRNERQQREVSLEMRVVPGAEGVGGERWQRMRRRKESRVFTFQDGGCASSSQPSAVTWRMRG